MAPVAHAKKMYGEDISNMIIQGENRLKVRPQIPEAPISADIYKDMTTFLKDNSVLGSLKPPAVEHPPVVLPQKSLSNKTATPWLDQIYEPPVLTLNLKTEESKRKMQWMFLVKDSHGQTFYEVRKKGALPSNLRWEGIGNSGDPLNVGYDYSYVVSLIDEAGNFQRVAGKPFRLDSFRYSGAGGIVTSFYPEALFIEASSTKFSIGGRDYLLEVKDFLRGHYGAKVEIITYDDDLKFGQTRSQVIKDFLVKVLDYPEDKINVDGQRLDKGRGYKHVDIITK
jgi:hypothetical protein